MSTEPSPTESPPWLHPGLQLKPHVAGYHLGDAIAEFQEAIRLDPEFPWAYMGLGYSYAWQGNLAEAIEALETYLRLAPNAENRADVEAERPPALVLPHGDAEHDLVARGQDRVAARGLDLAALTASTAATLRGSAGNAPDPPPVEATGTSGAWRVIRQVAASRA